MNIATTPPPKTDLATSHRLRACIASLCIFGLAGVWRERNDAALLAVNALGFPVFVWIAWIGIYRSPFLHKLWGGACLVFSCALIVSLALELIGLRIFHADRLSPALVIGVVQMPILAYFLIFDERIAAYRRQLAGRQPLQSTRLS